MDDSSDLKLVLPGRPSPLSDGTPEPVRIVLFDFAVMEDFEVGAGLLALLAFPGVADFEKRWKAAEALCAWQIRETIAGSPMTADVWRQTFPNYAHLSKGEERRRLRTLRRRLKDRMWAARMSLGFFQEALTNEPVSLPAELRNLSLDALSAYVKKSERAPTDSTENFEHRVWRASRPVIHLAAALQVVLRRHAEIPDDIGGNYPLDRGDLHREVIALAEAHEPLVARHMGFGKRPIRLIRVRAQN